MYLDDLEIWRTKLITTCTHVIVYEKQKKKLEHLWY